MATFVLIHGSWHGGWCFDGVKAMLEVAGHEVIAPDLPGMGGDAAALRAVTLAGWGEFAAQLCRDAAQHPVVLVGHSRGGIVISAAAEQAPDAIDALVYVCAMMLPDGMSRAEFRSLVPPNPAYAAMVSATEDDAGSVVDPKLARDVFAQLSPPDAVAAAMTRLVAEPNGPRDAPLHITPARFGSIPRTYVECTEDRTIPIESQRLMQRLVPGAKIVTLDADHSPFLSQPRALANALIAAIPVT
jgi:pimeloyl-ACP methyl ester carboxylesterase